MNREGVAISGKLLLLCLAILGAALSNSAMARSDSALEKRLSAHINVLASDEFQGREPGTEGEAKTLKYLGREWFSIGLVSGTNDPGNEWFAPVTLVAREPAASKAVFSRRGKVIAVPADAVLLLTSGKRSLVRAAPLLFVGRDSTPDFSRNELAGRVAVMLDDGKESGERQSALLNAGASSVLTVLDGSRTLEQIAARRQRSGYALAVDSLGGDLEGFITREGITALLQPTGYSLLDLEKAAEMKDFAPLPLGLHASLEATTRETTIHTYNLIGKLPGKNPASGAVLLVAHWDHFGICAEPPAEELICSGAIDNASGVAAMTEIARRLTKLPRLDRDVYFLATTAEELGLLGAHAFAENPPLPLTNIVAAFNLDTLAIAPSGTPVAIVGKGMTNLDEDIVKVARRERRKIVLTEEANEFVRRQDGWALLQHDIPAVMVTSAYGEIERMRRFFDTNYHRPSDNLSQNLELGGAAEDVQFHVALVRWFGDAKKFSPVKK